MSKWLAPINLLLALILKLAGLLYLTLGIIILIAGIRPPLKWIFRRLFLAIRTINRINPIKAVGNIMGRL